MAILFEKTAISTGDWREVGRTERLDNTLNPRWLSKLTIDYRFEENQPLKLEIYDWDTNNKFAKGKLKNQDFLGRLECTLAAVVSSPGKQYTAVLRSESGTKGAGMCYIVAEEVTGNKEVATFHFSAKDLDKKDTFGKEQIAPTN